MTPRIALAFLLAFALLGAAAQAQYTVRDASRFWIDGTSTVSAFTCAASEIAGSGAVDEAAMGAERSVEFLRASLSL